ncbi:hypothetical protein GC176_01755 [bacterium]|nr:hypothetical protein [bacterium]
MRKRLTLAIACVAGALAAMSIACAQDDATQLKPTLKFELRNQQTARTGGPIPLTYDLVWDGAGATLLEGRLELSLTDGIENYGHYVSADLAINPGRTTYRVLLPSIEGRSAFPTFDLIARFVTSDNEIIDLEARPLRVTPDASRFFRVVFCDPVAASDDRRVSAFLKSLKFEQFWQSAPRSGDQELRLDDTPVSVFDSVRPPEMPLDPHWYCASSMVVLSRNGFSELRSKKLDVLLQWVRAGGSLCVEPLSGLDDEHLTFLNALAAEASDIEFVVDERGLLTLPKQKAFEHFPSGFGQVAVLYAGLQDSLDTTASEWKSVVTALWNFRADQQQSITSKGKFRWLASSELYPENSGGPNRNGYNPYYGYPYQQNLYRNQPGRLSVQPIQSVQGLLERLMPQDVEVVPLPYIGAILLLYLLTIGPVDYFVLGAFKARRFTWITFPLATVGFTLFTVWLSNSFLSSSAERTFVEVLDVMPNGEVARSNRLELLFTMSSTDVTTDVRSGVFTALDHSRFGGTVHDQYRRQVHRRTVPAPTIVGRPPGYFAAVQAVPKWTPQINRIFQIAPDPETLPSELVEFDWRSPRDFRSNAGQQQLRQAVQTTFGNDAIAVLFNGRKAVDLLRNRTAVFQEAVLQMLDQDVARNNQQWLYTDFLWDVSVRLQGQGLFGAVNRVSPHGGANFEDMTLLDPSDPNQWLLVIVRPDGENMTIYRRLYQLSPDPPTADRIEASANGASGKAATENTSDQNPFEARND